jgi:hypothetical protein
MMRHPASANLLDLIGSDRNGPAHCVLGLKQPRIEAVCGQHLLVLAIAFCSTVLKSIVVGVYDVI